MSQPPHGEYICAQCGYVLVTLHLYANLTMRHVKDGRHVVQFVAEDVGELT